MVTTLRYALTGRERENQYAVWLALAGVVVVFGPLLPGLFWAFLPAFSRSAWSDLWADPEWPLALGSTLISTILGSALALVFALLMAVQCYGGPAWSRLQRQLPLLLSVPHAAFAVGLLFLLAPSGWLMRLLAPFAGWVLPPAWVTVQDPWGLSLAFALALKECWFLLWVLAAILAEHTILQQMTIAQTMGYSRLQAWRHILLPQLLPRLAWPMLAVFAYGLSVVDMAVILGPSNPATMAVLIWHWLSDPHPLIQAKGSAATLVMGGLLLSMMVLLKWGWWACRVGPYPKGVRRQAKAKRAWHCSTPLLAISYAVLACLLMWSMAEAWFFPAIWPETLSLRVWANTDFTPFFNSLYVASAAVLLALPITLIWLEWGPQRFNTWLYLPLIIPAMPLAAGQYAVLLKMGLANSYSSVIWSHLLWVVPYILLTLTGPYRAYDQRFMVMAQALGKGRFKSCLTVKWPMLMRPIFAAMAIGFSVSIAQYLPTLFAGGGRIVTATTEAVALSSGGNRRILAVQALLQVMLPLGAFILAAGLPRWLSRHRQGLKHGFLIKNE
jgi:putative thiamine transport system permease protein